MFWSVGSHEQSAFCESIIPIETIEELVDNSAVARRSQPYERGVYYPGLLPFVTNGGVRILQCIQQNSTTGRIFTGTR